jgi:2-polyprenyl-3-methyl-5-hydroxy-6-metoxy-1,4-benzoquinol methylase
MTLRWKIAQAAEIRWWQRYLKNKPTTDYAQWKENYWRKLLEDCNLSELNDASRDLSALRVLDAGCGPAGIFMIFKNQKVDALDPLLDEYEKTLPHFKKSNYPNTTFFAQPLEDFDKREEYNAVFCLNAINHVADLEKCFDILVNSVKKGGHLIVSIDAHNHGVLKKIFQALPGDILHPHQYDLKEYSDMLISRGCSIEKTVLYKPEFIFNYYILVCKKG